MKIHSKLTDEIPITREGLIDYIYCLEKYFKPISIQYNRMDDLLKEARLRLKRMPKNELKNNT